MSERDLLRLKNPLHLKEMYFPRTGIATAFVCLLSNSGRTEMKNMMVLSARIELPGRQKWRNSRISLPDQNNRADRNEGYDGLVCPIRISGQTEMRDMMV